MRTLRLMVLVVAFGVLWTGTAHASIRHTWRVNLDGDPHLEKVELIQKTAHDSFPRRWLVIKDRVHGTRVTRRITPRLWFLSRHDVRIADLNAHPRRPEIWYLGCIGGTAGSPTYAGIKGWDGRHVHTFFRFAPPYPERHHDGRTYGYDGVQISVKQIPSGNEPAFEIKLNEAEITGSAPLCCPQYEFIQLLRYDQASRSWVAYQRRWHKL